MKRELSDGTIVDFTLEEQAEYDAKLAARTLEEQQNGYKQAREEAYAPIKDQLDMLYWDLKNGTTTFIEHRDAVKALYPKPV